MNSTVINLVTVDPKPIEPWVEKEDKRGTLQKTWKYSHTQQTRRYIDRKTGKKRVLPFIGKDTGPWISNSGDEPWPLYQPAELTGWETDWILEVEGEKCADLAASAGYACISQPGHDGGLEKIKHRYRHLKCSGIKGIIYFADADAVGKTKAEKANDAAQAVEIPLVVIHARDLFPDIPEGGSLDDVNDVREAIEAIVEAARRQELSAQDDCADEPIAVIAGIPKETPAEAQLPQATGRNQFTFAQLLPLDLASACEEVSQPWSTDPLTVVLTYICGLSGLLKLGTEFASTTDNVVPANLNVCLVGSTGTGKTPILKTLVKKPAEEICTREAETYKAAKDAWSRQNDEDRGSEPVRLFSQLENYTAPALDLQLEKHEAAKRGILLIRDELSGLFGQIANDKKSGSGNAESQLLELWDGTGSSTIRIGSDARSFQRCKVSLIGGIQPEVLQKLVDGQDVTGRWARMLFLTMPKGIIRPRDEDPTEENLRRYANAQQTLADYAEVFYGMEPRRYNLSRAARVEINKWFVKNQERSNEDATNPAFAPLLRKSMAHALRIAGLLHLIKHRNLLEISDETTLIAMAIVDQIISETESFHNQPKFGVIEQLQDRIKAHGGEVRWTTLREKGLNRYLKDNCKAADFNTAAQDLANRGEGSLDTRNGALIWRP